jgi:hypothetical protein
MMDGGWDQKASGKAYYSASGPHVSAGGRTNKVCALVYYSKRCSKYEKGNPHPDSLCANPDKYAKFLRAMESLGAVQTVLDRMGRVVFHKFSTNKTEQIYSFVTNIFLMKRSYYCRTICGRART